ncbi:UDP-glucuronosyltransferase 2B7 [Ooceraea biroi]|uniref:UDP-glucuronosyltransferase 2B7 n=1 Tax=Ooceraea biroi TaxID=2015173 RepID=UPI000F098402|nr:UDP-glucuronosyltransferase 2B7 [Ooceraea biroi]
MRAVVYVLYVILFLLSLSANAGRILSLSVVPFLSHQLIHRTLNLALHKRGHELVIVTTAPLKDPTLKNYTEIDVSYGFSIITEYNDAKWKISQMESCRQVFTITTEFMGTIWDNPEFKKIYRRDSGEKFDAIMIEPISDLSLYSMAHRFNAPLIGLTPMGFHNFQRYIFASPMLPSHPSNWEVNTLVEGYPSFWQRLQNFIDVWGYLYAWSHHVVMARKRVEKYFGSDTPDPMDIAKNMSIVLVNENPLFAYARPEQPNVIYFSGSQIQKTPPTLPKDLRRFLDDATKGFIYVSLGTTVSCHNLPTEIMGNFIEVFSKLPFKIVWKYECDEFPGKLDNIFISKWFPQQGILAHPNIRLFIYQGGLHSTEEAVHYAVPLLGLPIMFEQASRIQRLASLGAAIFLKLNELSKERLNTAIHQILNDKSYKERMAYLSKLSKDQPYDSFENAIWWIEYVMRHKGISHLRFSESDKPWYQRYDMDIIGFLAVIAFIMSLIFLYTLFRILRFCYGYYHLLYKNVQYPNTKLKMQ